MEDEGATGNNLRGSHNQGVNIVITHGAGFWLALAVLAVVILVAFTAKASIQAGNAVKASENLSTEYRMTQFWMQRATVACQQNGVPMPPIPASMK